ncbi:MAG: HAMP domain-containing histidine kinase [Marinospirillum sp.]|uniref:sensor histidine kinase n=1 Tax=Marinospirillum sp. TaxID=2183934 RepID=UPI001A020C07|nr:HAMP domain-containing sensor histidine kinase [Marinospirillum sp.]MBE0508669.1 HAMP domain-containing histidine kinase [Marinospirillum sp.]
MNHQKNASRRPALPFNRSSLAWQHTRQTLLAAVVLGVLLSLVLILVDLQQTRSNINNRMDELLLTTSNAATQAAYTLDATLAEEVLEGLFAVQSLVYGQLMTERERVLAQKDRRDSQPRSSFDHLLGRELVFSQPLIWNNIHTGERLPVGQLQIRVNGGVAGADFSRRVLWELVFGVIRNVLLAFIILIISNRLLTRPLADIAHALQQGDPRDFKPLKPLPAHQHDEIGRVVTAFNALTSSLKQSNVELARLSEVMAHHFQEPTRRLVAFSQRLGQNQLLRDQPDTRVSLEFVESQARRLSDLVRDVQRYLALDQLRLEPTTLDARQNLQQLLSSAAYTKALQKVDVRLSEDWPAVFFAERRMKDIWQVLLDNALLYRSKERPLQISISAVHRAGRVVFRFEDNGQGINLAYREQVFEIFVRLVPNNEAYPGTGMGLALAKKLIHQAGGDIRVESAELGGACFVFDLPGAAVEQSNENNDENNR